MEGNVICDTNHPISSKEDILAIEKDIRKTLEDEFYEENRHYKEHGYRPNIDVVISNFIRLPY